VKAWKRESPDALVKVVDFELSRHTTAIADRLVVETRRDPGVVEVGYEGGLRLSLGRAERPAADGGPGMALGPESVMVMDVTVWQSICVQSLRPGVALE
jgi:hypothetical protein